MPGYTATVGNVELVSLTDGSGDRDPVETFPDSTIAQWRSDYPELLDKNEHIHPRLGAVAVRSSRRLIMVDTGLQAPGGTLLKELRQKGIYLEAVDIVIFTHLHRDHVGWNLINGKPTFLRARYLVPKAEWEYWTRPTVLKDAPHIRDQVMALEKLGIMDLIEGEHKITDELTAVPTPGHTPGHISIAILSAGQRGFILGDVANSVAQAHYTDWNPVFDVNKAQARRTRHQVLDRLEAEGSLVSAGHFPEPGFGRLLRRQGRRVWQAL